MYFFRILWGIDALAAVVILYFFAVGLGDGTVSSVNAGLWLLILAALATVLLGSLWLRGQQHAVLANILLALLAAPALLYAVFFLILIIANPRWN